MPLWTPSPLWQDQDAYIIGGGASLETFDWSLLQGRLTIGCNAAFRLGLDVCKVCAFGDRKFLATYSRELEQASKAGMPVYTNTVAAKAAPHWLWVLPRQRSGLHTDALGWNENTGAMAVNLALLLGARRVFLLGFDMKLTDGKANWHPHACDKPDAEVYPRFMLGFFEVKRALPRVFPGREIVNVNDNSGLLCFPTVTVAGHFVERES